MMNGKEFLKKMVSIDVMIETKADNLTRLRSMATNISPNSAGERVQSSGSPEKMANTIAKIVDMEKSVNADIDELIEMKLLAQSIIEQIQSDRQKIVLYKRYFQRKTFEVIAVECSYSWRTVHRIHADALISFNEIYKNSKLS